jgi:microcystin-dependent protein
MTFTSSCTTLHPHSIMSANPILGEIIMFGGNFAPRGWAFCDGQLLTIASNTALYSIFGTQYGGDGRVTFALPDLRGRVVIHPGDGPGLSSYRQGDQDGEETTSLTEANLPAHNHEIQLVADTGPGTTATPGTGTMPAEASEDIYSQGGGPLTNTLRFTSEYTGSGTSMNNIQPFVSIYFIVALEGVFPSRS